MHFMGQGLLLGKNGIRIYYRRKRKRGKSYYCGVNQSNGTIHVIDPVLLPKS
ncbi:MAG: hypothetical protein KBT69_06255 [Oceanihabitans sp.]|nr:hypothetical protein [Oceanihabitans sp.]